MDSLKSSLEILEEENHSLRAFIEHRLGKPYEEYLMNPGAGAGTEAEGGAGARAEGEGGSVPGDGRGEASGGRTRGRGPETGGTGSGSSAGSSSVVARSSEETGRAVKIDNADYRLVQALEQAQ